MSTPRGSGESYLHHVDQCNTVWEDEKAEHHLSRRDLCANDKLVPHVGVYVRPTCPILFGIHKPVPKVGTDKGIFDTFLDRLNRFGGAAGVEFCFRTH